MSHLETLLEEKEGKTKQAQQQHEAAAAELAAQLADLKTRMDTQLATLTSQLESEQKRRVAAEEQHKAAQAALALSSEVAEQLNNDKTLLLTEASKSSSTISGLREQAAQLQAALTAQTKETAAAAQLAKGHQQKMGLNMADLTSQLESERCRCAEAVADHKAAQADLADQVAYASGTTQQLKTQDAELASQAMKTKELTDQAAQLKAALTAAHAKSASAESAAAGQQAQVQQQLEALRADHIASVDNTKIVRAEMAASVASAEQEVKRLEQQLAGSQAAAAQQLEEIKKVHQRELKSQAMKNAQTVNAITDQAAQLKAALTAAHDKAAAEAAAAAQKAQAHQQQLDALRADHTASADSNEIVHVELEAAKLQISTLKAQSDTSREEVDSGRAAKLQGLLEKSQANVASAEQKVKRLEQQLAGSPADAALHQTELKKLNKARSEAVKSLRMLGDTCGKAARLRTDLRRAEDKLEDEADCAAELHRQIYALSYTTQDLHEQLRRKSWRAVEAEAKAEKEASELRVQLAAAQASHESAQQKVKRLEQQLVGSQAAVAPKEEQQLVAQVALTQEQASKVLGQLEAALVDLSSLPGMKRSAWFERNRVTAILEAICEDRDHSHVHMVTQVENIHKLVDALASSCRSVRSELRDAQVDQNKTRCQLESALVEKLESDGELEKVKKMYKRLKGQHEKALNDLSYQEQLNDALLDAEQPSTELAESQTAQSSSIQQANQNGPWEVAQHVQQQRFPNSHNLDRNSPQGPLLSIPKQPTAQAVLANHAAAMANGQEDEAQQQHKRPVRGICAGKISKEHMTRGRNPGQQGDVENVEVNLTDGFNVDDSPAAAVL
ncbi:TPA: hypothetical protein ACH3X3_004340 [Trebouxia sp. C0006]